LVVIVFGIIAVFREGTSSLTNPKSKPWKARNRVCREWTRMRSAQDHAGPMAHLRTRCGGIHGRRRGPFPKAAFDAAREWRDRTDCHGSFARPKGDSRTFAVSHFRAECREL